MARKRTAKDLLIESFGGSRHSTGLFGGMSDDEFIGYITAMTYSQDGNKFDGGPSDMLDEARRLVASKELD